MTWLRAQMVLLSALSMPVAKISAPDDEEGQPGQRLGGGKQRRVRLHADNSSEGSSGR
ncbi:hypothetical protein [Nonomuraea sp. B19D2]|uniref:hypothetical protein n=1 Tax=Nonomuraea sp. B19D2 TaxID=3159561 RepID=UPI0032DB6E16